MTEIDTVMAQVSDMKRWFSDHEKREHAEHDDLNKFVHKVNTELALLTQKVDFITLTLRDRKRKEWAVIMLLIALIIKDLLP